MSDSVPMSYSNGQAQAPNYAYSQGLGDGHRSASANYPVQYPHQTARSGSMGPNQQYLSSPLVGPKRYRTNTTDGASSQMANDQSRAGQSDGSGDNFWDAPQFPSSGGEW